MIDKNSSKRTILRKILYRIDFQLITEQMQENLFAFVSSELGEHFSMQQQEMENSVDINIDNVHPDQSRVTPKAQPVFIFSRSLDENCDGRILKIGRTFLYLELALNVTSTHISYREWIARIVSWMQTNSVFRLSRIGLRKFNSFYILDSHKNMLNEIFSIDYLSKTNNTEFELDNFENMQVYNRTPFALNFYRTYTTGNLNNPALNIENEPAHLITFDFDLHTSDVVTLNTFLHDSAVEFEKMNRMIYDFFASIMHEDALAKLNNGNFETEYHVIPF